jgi:hypothetical protein
VDDASPLALHQLEPLAVLVPAAHAGVVDNRGVDVALPFVVEPVRGGIRVIHEFHFLVNEEGAPIVATMPKLIRVERVGRTFSLTVDGEEFPYYIRDDDIDVSVAQIRGGSVRLTLLAERVEVVNDFNDPEGEVDHDLLDVLEPAAEPDEPAA